MNQASMNQESMKAATQREPGRKTEPTCGLRLASAPSCLARRESQETKRFLIC